MTLTASPTKFVRPVTVPRGIFQLWRAIEALSLHGARFGAFRKTKLPHRAPQQAVREQVRELDSANRPANEIKIAAGNLRQELDGQVKLAA